MLYKEIIRGFSLYQILFLFIIYAFLGWCLEVIYASFKTKKFINRGFLNGIVCPIYGLGAIIVILLLEPVKNNGFLIFFLSMLITTTIEFMTGLLLELIFHNKWWDYSKRKFNIKGYICLEFSVIWGLCCLFAYDIIHPVVMYPINHVPTNIGIIILIVLLSIFVLDVIMALIQATRFDKYLKKLNKSRDILKSSSNIVGEKLSVVGIKMASAYEVLLNKKMIFKNRLIKAFPNMKHKKYNLELNDVKNNKMKEVKQDEEN